MIDRLIVFRLTSAVMGFSNHKLQAKRSAAGVTQRAFARAVGLHPVHYNRIERGKVSPNTRTLLRIACALGCRLDELASPDSGGSEGVA